MGPVNSTHGGPLHLMADVSVNLDLAHPKGDLEGGLERKTNKRQPLVAPAMLPLQVGLLKALC